MNRRNDGILVWLRWGLFLCGGVILYIDLVVKIANYLNEHLNK